MASSSKTMIIKGGDLSAAVKGGYCFSVKGGYCFSVLNPIFRTCFSGGVINSLKGFSIEINLCPQ